MPVTGQRVQRFKGFGNFCKAIYLWAGTETCGNTDMDWWPDKPWKKLQSGGGKDTLILAVQILSPVRCNIPFNYQTMHLCKQPTSSAAGVTQEDFSCENSSSYKLEHTLQSCVCGCVCVCAHIKKMNGQKKGGVCLRVVLRAAWREPGDCGNVWWDVCSTRLSCWSGGPSATWSWVNSGWS